MRIAIPTGTELERRSAAAVIRDGECILLLRATYEFLCVISRALMALAIYFDGRIQSGAVKNYSELAGLGNVTRARMTLIMNLLMLDPGLQEQILSLQRVEAGRDEVCLKDLQPVEGLVGWREHPVTGLFLLPSPSSNGSILQSRQHRQTRVRLSGVHRRHRQTLGMEWRIRRKAGNGCHDAVLVF
jgi:hypothetical protein